MVSVKMMPDGDGEDVEDDAASIFTIILCLTTLHRCCSNSGYVCINIWWYFAYEYLYYIPS